MQALLFLSNTPKENGLGLAWLGWVWLGWVGLVGTKKITGKGQHDILLQKWNLKTNTRKFKHLIKIIKEFSFVGFYFTGTKVSLSLDNLPLQ